MYNVYQRLDPVTSLFFRNGKQLKQGNDITGYEGQYFGFRFDIHRQFIVINSLLLFVAVLSGAG